LDAHPHLSGAQQARRLLYETIRQMLSAQVRDVIASTQHALSAAAPCSVWDVRAQPVLVVFSPQMRVQSTELKSFLFDRLYRHAQVVSTMNLAKQIVRELFAVYAADPKEMSSNGPGRIPEGAERHRSVADYVAGMTDRFATSEHHRLTGSRLLD
jgi:dGTPase